MTKEDDDVSTDPRQQSAPKLPLGGLLTASSWATVAVGLAGAEFAPVPDTFWVLTELVAAAALGARPRPPGPLLPLPSAGMSFQ